MAGVLAGLVVALLASVAIALGRVLAGPTLYDRILGVNLIGTKAVVLLAVVGYVARRPGFYLDIALTYGLINFLATLAVLRYVERRTARSGSKEPTL